MDDTHRLTRAILQAYYPNGFIGTLKDYAAETVIFEQNATEASSMIRDSDPITFKNFMAQSLVVVPEAISPSSKARFTFSEPMVHMPDVRIILTKLWICINVKIDHRQGPRQTRSETREKYYHRRV